MLAQILINCGGESVISPHELSFATSFVVVVLFIMVKATRPMTYQYLTINIVESVKDGGFINQTRLNPFLSTSLCWFAIEQKILIE